MYVCMSVCLYVGMYLYCNAAGCGLDSDAQGLAVQNDSMSAASKACQQLVKHVSRVSYICNAAGRDLDSDAQHFGRGTRQCGKRVKGIGTCSAGVCVCVCVCVVQASYLR